MYYEINFGNVTVKIVSGEVTEIITSYDFTIYFTLKLYYFCIQILVKVYHYQKFLIFINIWGFLKTLKN